ncbi:MAG: RimK/LysX family protein [Gracilimonas sp.]|jgi:hypothetical protein|nr:RimK/LysX family protein [Gracilimonas sp.]
MKSKSYKIIGRTELVDLTEWDFFDLEAKVDTGAYTSSLHCHDIETYKNDHEPWVRFYLLDPEHEAYNEKKLELPIHDQREVKSSNGETELRFFIQTRIMFYDKEYLIEFSLADRSAMKYPVLIGRKFLKKGPFVVDVTKTNLSPIKKTRRS